MAVNYLLSSNADGLSKIELHLLRPLFPPLIECIVSGESLLITCVYWEESYLSRLDLHQFIVTASTAYFVQETTLYEYEREDVVVHHFQTSDHVDLKSFSAKQRGAF